MKIKSLILGLCMMFSMIGIANATTWADIDHWDTWWTEYDDWAAAATVATNNVNSINYWYGVIHGGDLYSSNWGQNAKVNFANECSDAIAMYNCAANACNSARAKMEEAYEWYMQAVWYAINNYPQYFIDEALDNVLLKAQNAENIYNHPYNGYTAYMNLGNTAANSAIQFVIDKGLNISQEALANILMNWPSQ